MSSGKQPAANGKPPSDSTVTAIADLISNDDELADDEIIAELLQQIEREENAMDAIEGRLDLLLEQLNDLVQVLEVDKSSNGGQESRSATSAPSDSGVKEPSTDPDAPHLPGQPVKDID